MVIRLIDATVRQASTTSCQGGDEARWTCSFVNNMPDSTFRATEGQFLDLLAAGSGHDVVEVRRHAVDGIVRDATITSYINENYSSLSTMKESPPDILIVTGSNPLEAHIDEEPYWGEMRDVLEWGSLNVSSMLLSCLAAHAALVIFDRIERIRLDGKCTGVFRQDVDSAHPLAVGLGHDVNLPHSRMNTTDVEQMRDHGYAIALQSVEVGWSVATKRIGACDVVLVQAHPEYEPTSLLREYRRDARRYVTRERSEPPILPARCVAELDWAELENLHIGLRPTGEGVALIEDYPFDEVGGRTPWSWHDAAERLYANWLNEVKGAKGHTHA